MRQRRIIACMPRIAAATAFALAPLAPAQAGGGIFCGAGLSDAAIAAALAPFDLPPEDAPRRDGACHAACLRSDRKAPPFCTRKA